MKIFDFFIENDNILNSKKNYYKLHIYFPIIDILKKKFKIKYFLQMLKKQNKKLRQKSKNLKYHWFLDVSNLYLG